MASVGLNILVLHNLGDPSLAPEFLEQMVFSLKVDAPGNNYLFHDTALPLPGYIQDVDFDVIILDVTFLCARWLPPEQFEKIKEDYQFVKFSHAVKLSLPQDEYDCNELLDEWMSDWGVDVVFSVISDNRNILYPRYHKVGRIELAYTGYVNERLIDIERRPFIDRHINVGYRARKLPPYFGRIGETKWTIGRDFERHAREVGLSTDIVLGDQGTLLGKAWFDFIGGCEFTLGANSGSSLLDPRGDIQRKVRAYLAQCPTATFEEVEANFFKGQDGHHSFTAISPRVLEAALMESCQILVEGEYSGIIQPWEHYIPIASDASNFEDVYSAMRDRSLVSRLIKNCRDRILDARELRHGTRSRKLMDVAHELLGEKRHGSSPDRVITALKRYENEMSGRYRRKWAKARLLSRLVRSIHAHPVASKWVSTAYARFKGFGNDATRGQ